MVERQQQGKKKAKPVTAEVAFGLVLRELRSAAGLTQGDLEAKSAVDRSYISQIENGQKQVCLKPIIQLAVALGTTPGHLLDRVLERMDPKELKKLL